MAAAVARWQIGGEPADPTLGGLPLSARGCEGRLATRRPAVTSGGSPTSAASPAATGRLGLAPKPMAQGVKLGAKD